MRENGENGVKIKFKFFLFYCKFQFLFFIVVFVEVPLTAKQRNSETAKIRFNPIGSAGAKFYTGPTVGIGYGSQSGENGH
jgi:hypothetical protein